MPVLLNSYKSNLGIYQKLTDTNNINIRIYPNYPMEHFIGIFKTNDSI